MDSLNQQSTEDISEEEEDNRDDLDGSSRESRHRLHIVEDDAATTLSMLDAYSSQLLRARLPDNVSDSSDSLHHDEGQVRSFHVEEDESDEQSPSPCPYPGSGSYVSMSVMDSIEAIRRSRLLRGRVGEQSPSDSDEDLQTTTDQSKLYVFCAFNVKACKKVRFESSCSYWQFKIFLPSQ